MEKDPAARRFALGGGGEEASMPTDEDATSLLNLPARFMPVTQVRTNGGAGKKSRTEFGGKVAVARFHRKQS